VPAGLLEGAIQLDGLPVWSGMRKILILLGAVAVFVAGCGGGGSSTAVKLSGNTTNKGTKDLTGSSIDLEQDDFYFNPTFIRGGTPGATITVHLKNEGKNQHTFTSASLGVDEVVDPDQTKDVTITLPQSGASEFHCRFHQQSNGMQGAFFFKDGDTVVGASPGGASSTSSSTSQGGYDYN
jgi:plastocyanin